MKTLLLLLAAYFIFIIPSFAQAPIISVDPDSLSEDLFSGKSITRVLTINNSTGTTTWQTAQDLVTIPAQYTPPTSLVTYLKDFPFENEDNIGTLIVKTDESEGTMSVILPPVIENQGRTITIRSYRVESGIDVYWQGEDFFDGVSVQPLQIAKGVTYTIQAVFDEKTGLGTWYVNGIYP